MKSLWILLCATTLLHAESSLASLQDQMTEAAQVFLGCLSQEEREQTQLPFDHQDRFNWHYFPVEIHQRKGLCFNTMSSEQRLMALSLLSTGLSREGFRTALGIMSMEDEVHRIEQGKGRFHRHSELYHLTIFGNPAPNSHWAWRIEGHHLSLNYTFINGQLVSCSPAFFGANPKKVALGSRAGYAVLGTQDNAAAPLIQSLTAASLPPLPELPSDITTKAQQKVDAFSSETMHTNLSPEQLLACNHLAQSYLQIVPSAYQHLLLAPSSSGSTNWSAAYIGSMQPAQPHYYRIQANDFLLEYSNTQANASHAHAVIRCPNKDFGRHANP